MNPRGRLAVAGAGVAVVLIAVLALVVFHDGDAGGTDCSRFRVTPDVWARAAYDRRLQLREGLKDCGRIGGRSDTDVIAMLGPPDGGGTRELDYNLPFAGGRQVWRILVGEDGKVTGERLQSA